MKSKLDIKEKILHLFEDDSFPSLVVLNGKWGIGKTVYIKTEFIPKVENAAYVSVAGLRTRDDFINHLLGALNNVNGEGANFLAKSLKTTSVALDKALDKTDKGLLAFFSGVAGIAKETMLNQIGERLIVVDDIERLSEISFAKQVIELCYNLAEQNGTKFLFATDFEKLSAEKEFKEKFFNDVVAYQPTVDDLIKIAFSDEIYKHHHLLLESNLTRLEVDNLRVMIRMSKRIKFIYSAVLRQYEVNEKRTLEGLINDAFSIIFLAQVGKSESEIKAFYSAAYGFAEDDELDKQYRQKIGGSSMPLEGAISIFSGNDFHLNDLFKVVRLFSKGDPVDEAIYKSTMIGEILTKDFLDQNVDVLKNYIYNEKSPDLNRWLEACSAYITLIIFEYIEVSESSYLDEVENLFQSKSFTISEERGRIVEVKNARLSELGDEYYATWQKYKREAHFEHLCEEVAEGWRYEALQIEDWKVEALSRLDIDYWVKSFASWEPYSFRRLGIFLLERLGYDKPKSLFSIEHEARFLKLIHKSIVEYYEVSDLEFGSKRAEVKRLVFLKEKQEKFLEC
ncbi:hypothetical protein ALT761_02562 [Alteromonas sp. 76-1]|jgi:hypothetical protein|uniref:P-loop NTPase fold protein n=1 Tax=Alteromonas sp. 76-1 TaxID=2358187 RepID=UPI000FD18072|nr:P-loop NTPase fold protein [Alteromonas sp. 76-1]VEL97558.1 hypothetical protein ALT761_02562 [Alteromonas sp. 76-1]